MQTDIKGQVYESIAINGGYIRVTIIPNGWSNSRCLRIQIEEENGHLRQGPEIPTPNIDELINLLTNLKEYNL
jgi:hypothetical protein